MTPKTVRRAARSHVAGRRVTVSQIQLSSMLLALLSDFAVNEATAWKDEGHMLVAAVAREFMKPTTVSRVEGALQLWKSQYPSTSALESAAVWLDHLACTRSGDYCNFPRQDGIRLFKTWHYCSVPWNPQNIPLRPIDQVLPLPVGGADWALSTIYNSLQGCTGDKREVTPAEERASPPSERSKMGRRRLFPSALQVRASAVTRVGHQRDEPRRSGTAVAEKVQKEEQHRWSAALTVPDSSSTSMLVFPSVPPLELYPQGVAQGAEETQEENVFLPATSADGDDGFVFAETSHGLETSAEMLMLPTGGVCSVLAYNLYLRILIHVYGDVHQPLHNSEVFSHVFPKGDVGGNTIYVDLSHLKEKKRDPTLEYDAESGEKSFSRNLHGEWDSLFGQYAKFFHRVDLKKLREEAKRLVQKYPVAEHAAKTYADFTEIIRESHRIVREFVYSEFDWSTFSYNSLPYKPSKAYIAKVRQVGEERITLAGARLAFLLDSIADLLPSQSPTSSPRSPWRSPLATLPMKPVDVDSSDEWPELGRSGAAARVPPRGGTNGGRGARKEIADAAGNTENGADKPDSGLRFSENETGSGQHSQEKAISSPLIGSSASLAVAISAVVLLLLVAALCVAWRQLRLYKRALQVVVRRGGVAAEISGPAAAAAEAGDWRAAAALLGEYDEHPHQEKAESDCGEGASEASTVHDGAARLSDTTTSRLLTP